MRKGLAVVLAQLAEDECGWGQDPADPALAPEAKVIAVSTPLSKPPGVFYGLFVEGEAECCTELVQGATVG